MTFQAKGKREFPGDLIPETVMTDSAPRAAFAGMLLSVRRPMGKGLSGRNGRKPVREPASEGVKGSDLELHGPGVNALDFHGRVKNGSMIGKLMDFGLNFRNRRENDLVFGGLNVNGL